MRPSLCNSSNAGDVEGHPALVTQPTASRRICKWSIDHTFSPTIYRAHAAQQTPHCTAQPDAWAVFPTPHPTQGRLADSKRSHDGDPPGELCGSRDLTRSSRDCSLVQPAQSDYGSQRRRHYCCCRVMAASSYYTPRSGLYLVELGIWIVWRCCTYMRSSCRAVFVWLSPSV